MALSKTNVKNLLKDTLVKFYTDVFKPDLDSHTHNYAGSSTPGGAATSANKVNSNLTLQLNGTTNKTYNGSSAQTFNVTPANIGAATSSHTHNTLTIKGNSTTAIGTYNGGASTITITPANIGAATSDHTHEILTIKGNSTTAIGTYNGGAATITITPANIGAAASSHTHNYAGSSSAGGAATSANKVNKSLTIQTNGTEAAVFDGSTAKTINITPANIGAAASSHTHNYAGSSSSGGAATSANKVNSSLTIQGNGTTLGTFNGSAATIINITAANVGAATESYVDTKLGDISSILTEINGE